MLLYIKALGFSEFNTKEKTEELVKEVIERPTMRHYFDLEEDAVQVEFYKSYGKNFGLVAHGEIDHKKELIVYSIVPHAMGRHIMDTQEIDVAPNKEEFNYSGFCEEKKSGTPVSFYLQNIVEYMGWQDDYDVGIEGVRLSLFAAEGTVVFPVDKTMSQEEAENEEIENMIREELLKQARAGDEAALDALEEDALEAANSLRERLKTEDLLTVLEGFFMPIADSEDVYSVLGTIVEAKRLVNRVTKEEVWRIQINCMNIVADVYINGEDLIGKPSKDMRFKGSCWVHGKIEFERSDSLEDEL